MRFDPYAFIFLTLILSLQASYAAPLILLAQNRQDDRDRVQIEQDRQRAERNLADTEYLAREIVALRMALEERSAQGVSREVLRAELRSMLAELRDEAGVSKDLTLHSLRHSYVTHLLEFGYAERFVQEQVGHMHASTTSIYASVSSDYKNRVLAEALKALIEGEADDH